MIILKKINGSKNIYKVYVWNEYKYGYYVFDLVKVWLSKMIRICRLFIKIMLIY